MKAREIVARLELELGSNGAPVRLRTAIEHQLISYFGLSAIVAAEEAERQEIKVSIVISDKCIEAEKGGLLPTILLSGTTQTHVCGYSFEFNTDTALVAKIKQQRIHADKLLKKLRSLTFSEFERFGKSLLGELGAKHSNVTAQSNDQGIDFYGELTLGQHSDLPVKFFRLAHDVKFQFAGQAKHYPHRPIGSSVVRELIGAVSLAKTKTFSGDGIDIFKNLSVRPFSPVAILLISTGEISSGALYLAEASGIIARSGRQLAVFLADRGVGMIANDFKTEFSEAVFDIWLNS